MPRVDTCLDEAGIFTRPKEHDGGEGEGDPGKVRRESRDRGGEEAREAVTLTVV
jgi:hypothetical protein